MRLGAFLSRMEMLRMKAGYNCDYELSETDVMSRREPAHDFLEATIQLVEI